MKFASDQLLIVIDLECLHPPTEHPYSFVIRTSYCHKFLFAREEADSHDIFLVLVDYDFYPRDLLRLIKGVI